MRSGNTSFANKQLLPLAVSPIPQHHPIRSPPNMSMLRKTKQQIAHTSMIPSLGNRDLRTLQDVINSEKAFIKSNATSAQSWHANADSIKAWGDGEGDDLSDILSKMSLLFDNYTTAHTRLNTHLSTLRLHFKSIRTREEGLAELKSRKRSLASKIESVERKLSKMGPENKELMKTTSTLKEHRSEMDALNIELATEEAAIGDFKRRTTKEAMGLKCGGLLEFAEKVTIIAEIGKMIIDEIPLAETKPGLPRAEYNGHARTDQLLHEATRAISDVAFAPSGTTGHTRPDLSHLDSSLPLNDDYDLSQSQSNQPDALRQFVQQNDEGDDSAADAYRDQYAGGNGTYSAAADYNTTPIYASHQTTQPWLKDSASNRSFSQQQAGQLHTEGLNDSTDWQRHEHEGTDHSVVPSAPAADEAGWGHSSANDQHHQISPSHSQNAHLEQNRSSSPQHQSSTDIAAPSLPPLRASSPLPSGATPSGPAAVTPTATTAMDDESYFASIGSTRAAQAAARRPHSPTPSGSYANAPASFGAAAAAATGLPTTPSGSTYEPSDSGRKMTAAAFRKGFNRAPSSQHMAAPRSDDVPSREHTASPAGVPPLAIRKRQSAIVDAEPDYNDAAAPPYPHSSIPAHNDPAYETDYAYAPPPPVMNGSRPGSSSGHYGYPAPQQQQQQQAQSQGAHGYNLPGYASYAAGPGNGGH